MQTDPFMSTMTEQHALSLASIDAILADHPFGNSDYITNQLHVCYKRRLGKISSHLPAAGQLLNNLCQAKTYSQYRVIGDTTVRCAVQHALRQLETGHAYGLPLEECEQIFRATTRHLEQGDSECGPLGAGLANTIGPDPYDGRIWNESRPDDVFARAFRFVVQGNYGEQLCTPTSEETAMLEKAVRLLRELLPRSSRSALSHAHVIAVFPPIGAWTRKASSSEIRVSGTIFLSRTLLSNPWRVAEHLFHESLHQQMYDFRQGHSLLEETDFDREEAPRICSLWNCPDPGNQNYWDIHRALAAFHVYCHLSLLCSVAEQRAPELAEVYGPVSMVQRRTALARAHYLAEQIKALCWQELGQAGRRYVDWFTLVLESLDDTPPPPGSFIHLLVDRYRREASTVQFALNKSERHPDLSRELIILAKSEVASTCNVLAAMDAENDLRKFKDAIHQLSEEELGMQFPRVRSLIAKSILSISPDGFRLSDSRVPDEMFRRMVESSSERLNDLLGR